MAKRVEDQLRQIIVDRYESVNKFAKTIGMAYSTVDSILKRGVAKSSVTSILAICKELNLDVDALANGQIKFKNPTCTDNASDPSDITDSVGSVSKTDSMIRRLAEKAVELGLSEEELDIVLEVVDKSRHVGE